MLEKLVEPEEKLKKKESPLSCRGLIQVQMNDLSPHPPIIKAKPFLLLGCCHLVHLTHFRAILHSGNGKLEL